MKKKPPRQQNTDGLEKRLANLTNAGKGRPKGAVNKVTRDIRELCQGLVSRPKYQQWVAEQLDAGTLPPPLQQMIWAYGYGKPVQALDLNVSFDPVKYLARDDEADDD